MTELAKHQRRGNAAHLHPDPCFAGNQPADHEQRTRGVLEPLQVTLREAAQLLRYDERTVRRLITRGELRAVGTGRLRRIALADLRDWQERNRC